MNELLEKLLEAEVLSGDTKTELEEAFKAQIDEAVEAAKAEATADVRAELTEAWVTERDTLVEAVDAKVSDFLAEEMDELRADVEKFRDLEAEYAEKIVEERASMRDELKVDLGELVEQLDSFLEVRLSEELTELREDIQEQKKNDFGRRMFEAFSEEFANNYADDESLATTLSETKTRLSDTEQALEEAEDKLSAMERATKMKTVLAPLSGKQHDIMEAILKNISTDMLEEGYKTFIGRVVNDAAAAEAEEGNDKVLTEDAKNEEVLENATVVTGDNVEGLNETAKNEESGLTEDAKVRLQKMAGILN